MIPIYQSFNENDHFVSLKKQEFFPMVCIICYTIYNPGYISDAQFHRYKKQLQLQFHFKTRYTIHTNAYLHTITSNLRVHTITYASFTFTHAIQNDDIDMIPIDPRFPSLLIRSYDMIRYDTIHTSFQYM